MSYQAVTVDCNLMVLNCKGLSVCRRDFLQKLDGTGMTVLHVKAQPNTASSVSPAAPALALALLNSYAGLFTKGTGLVKGPPARIHLKSGATSKFCKARKVPFACKEKVPQELDRLTEAGIVPSVPYSEWAMTIVPVFKNSLVRICGDFKATLN